VRALVIAALLVAGCTSDVDLQWELDHDRIIAVRAEPPRIMAGEVSTLRLLAGYETLPAEERAPDGAQVVSPMSLADTVSFDGQNWIVTAPNQQRIDAARTELGLDADAPVPLLVGIAAVWPTPVMAVEGNAFAATKTVFLGETAENPPIVGLTINGVEPETEQGELVFDASTETTKTPLSVSANDVTDIVNWLTSCGEMHDFDLATSAYITFGPEDRTEGQLALVLRDSRGGVSWRLWSCRGE
jgi:hypothetical protein